MTEEQISFYKEWKDYMIIRIETENIDKNDFLKN